MWRIDPHPITGPREKMIRQMEPTFNLSTCCRSNQIVNGYRLIEMLSGFGINGLELEYRIHEKMVPDLEAALADLQMPVTSIHNYFPIPKTLPPNRGSGDLYRLMSPDPGERQQAVEATSRTIHYAETYGANAVVLHCGAVPMNAELDRLYRFYRKGRIDTADARKFIEEKLGALTEQKALYLERLKRSLEQLLPAAEAADVRLGLENRFHYHELPGYLDFGFLFDEFEGSPVGYWHDVGHAHAQEALGMIPEGGLLEMYEDALIGIHLHDALGIDDHLPPGAGEIDFESLRPYIRPDTLLVLELKPGTPDREIERGIEHIRTVLNPGIS